MSTGLLATIQGIPGSVVTYVTLSVSLVTGIGSALMSVALGKFQADCVRICPNMTGFYSSLFWTIALGS